MLLCGALVGCLRPASTSRAVSKFDFTPMPRRTFDLPAPVTGQIDKALVSIQFDARGRSDPLARNPHPFDKPSLVPGGAQVIRVNYPGPRDDFTAFAITFRDIDQRIIGVKEIPMSRLNPINRVSALIPDGAVEVKLELKDLPGIWRSSLPSSINVSKEVQDRYVGSNMYSPVCEYVEDGCEIKGALKAFSQYSKWPVQVPFQKKFSRKECMEMFYGKEFREVVESPIQGMSPAILVVLPIVQVAGDWREPYVGLENDAPGLLTSFTFEPRESYDPPIGLGGVIYKSDPPKDIELSILMSPFEFVPIARNFRLPPGLSDPQRQAMNNFADWLSLSPPPPNTATISVRKEVIKYRRPVRLTNQRWVKVRYPNLSIVDEQDVAPGESIKAAFEEAEAMRGLITWTVEGGNTQKRVASGRIILNATEQVFKE